MDEGFRMSKNRANFLSWLFVIAAVAVAAWLYPDIPDPVPLHWSIQRHADGYMAKPWGVVILPGFALFIFVFMRLIPVISPKGFRTEASSGVLHILQVVLVGFGSFIAILVLLQAYGLDARLNQLVFAACGLFFMVLGNYLGKLRKNFFLGIRTPWTLGSDDVWARTHRLGGWMFVLIGAIVFTGALFTITPGWLMLLILTATLVVVIYSYFIYRRVEGFGGDGDGSESE
jgi:uncharacterized membrane protein